mmetsp:Transcript_26390/g.44040  ORF Transcript_26390/g.44040 Transcript_26390/m.44040 type:complete len:466 (+) Transcript_26390:102-1499(+)
MEINQRKWATLDQFLQRPSPFGNETGQLPNGYYTPGPDLFRKLNQDSKVLVVGAGGLGCELLKDLALSGLTNIHVIDLDTIDISNLNRQFLFRMSDVGKAKAEAAAQFIMKRVPGCVVTPYQGMIQDKDEDFYKQFRVIISGLDNIEARRWLNSLIVGMVETDEDGDIDPDTIIPLIDGGTEGLKGQGRVILPKVTACFECTLASFPPQAAFPMCTIAETPRLPEHCIAYAYILEWERFFPGRKLDKDSPEDMQWVFARAQERALKFGIEGVTYFKTMGVVKNIIPAVASTNAIISAMCVNEALKLLTFSSQTVNNYYMYMGGEGLYTPTFTYDKCDTCVVCSDQASTRKMTVESNITLQEFMQQLSEDAALQLKKPSLIGESTSLYMQRPPSLEKALRVNLDKPLCDLVDSGEVLTVTDPTLRDVSLSIQVLFTNTTGTAAASSSSGTSNDSNAQGSSSTSSTS